MVDELPCPKCNGTMKRQHGETQSLTMTGVTSTVPVITNRFRCEACGHEETIDDSEDG